MAHLNKLLYTATNSAGTGMETAFIPSTYSSGKADVPHTGEPVTFTGFLKSE